MNLTISQKFRLGVFVSVGAGLLLLFSIVPIVLKLSERQKKYYAYFEGESLSGLEQGAIVKFHGVPVGKAVKISYDAKNLLRVKVDMTIQWDFPMKTDMYCQTGAMGITGLKYIEILGGTDSSALLKAESVIPTKQSMMASITGKAEVIMGKVEILLNHLNEISNPDSLHNIKTIVDNVAVITDDIHTFIANVKPQVETSASSLESIVTRVDSIARNMQEITAEVNDALEGGKVKSIMSSVDSTARSMKKMSDDVSLIVRQSREDFRISMTNLREALQNANELTKILAENPSLLLKGEQQKERVLK